MRLKLAIYACLLFFIIITNSPVLAQIHIEPSSFKLTLAPGETYSAKITVQNESGHGMQLRVEPEYWFPGNCQKKLASWLKIRADKWQLPARAQKEISLQLQAPPGMRGECLVMIFFAQEPVGKNIKIRPRIGIPLYVRQKGTEKIRGEVSIFRPEKTSRGRELPGLMIEVKNTGNIHILPLGLVNLKSKKLSENYAIDVNYRQPIFPQQSAKLRVGVKSSVPQGEYTAELKLFLNTLYPLEDGQKQSVVISKQCDWRQSP